MLGKLITSSLKTQAQDGFDIFINLVHDDYIGMKIFYPTFYVPLYILPITISYLLDCVRFFSILNISFLIRKGKKHMASYD